MLPILYKLAIKNIMPLDLQTTFIIKTFERPNSLFILLKSIDKFYPNVPIIIIDDSKKPLDKKWASHIQYIYTEFDIGLSEGRNRAVKLVKTKYFVLLDDDLEFTEQTKIETFRELLEKYNFDLIGGKYYHFGQQDLRFEGFLKIYRKVLYICLYEYLIDDCDAMRVDFTHNFFLAKTNVIQKNPWDSELKLAEHENFFLELKNKHVKVGYTPLVSINHLQDHGLSKDGDIINRAYYEGRVVRHQHYIDLFYKKKGLENTRFVYIYRLSSRLSLPFIDKNPNFFQRYYLFLLQFIAIRFLDIKLSARYIRYIRHTRYIRYTRYVRHVKYIRYMRYIRYTGYIRFRYKCLKKICEILFIDYDRLKRFYRKLTMKPVRD